jgi:thioredoxin reductase (NADPH)
LLRSAGLVECYPGFPGGIQATELVAAMESQARQLDVCIEADEVLGLRWVGDGYQLLVAGESWAARALILATGTTARAMPPGMVSSEVRPGQVHAVTSTLPDDLDGSTVWVSGGGDAAFDSALQLVGRGAKVEIGLRGSQPRAMPLLVRRARAMGVRLQLGCELCAVGAHGPALSLALSTQHGPVDRVVDQLLVCHGRDPEHTLWHQLASSQARGPRQVESHFPGLFMAGDLVRGDCRYAAVAVGDGLRCARLAEAHLERYRGGPQQVSPGSP